MAGGNGAATGNGAAAWAGGYAGLGLRTGAATGRGGSADTLARWLGSEGLISDVLVSDLTSEVPAAALREI